MKCWMPKLTRFYSSINYEIPTRYSDSFYLANSAFFDSVSWYVHRAYELSFPKLVTNLQSQYPHITNKEAVENINNAIGLLDQCNSIIDIRFPTKRESGKWEVIRGFRAQHGLSSGCTTSLGGLRVKENVTRDHMKALAVLSTYKHSCMGINMAGAHGAIKINPADYSEKELREIVQLYVAELFKKGYCNGLSDIIEPDLNTSSREMGWIASQFAENSGNTVVVGKPFDLGGIEHHDKTASLGVFFALDHFLNDETILPKVGIADKGLRNKSFILQGLGKLGSNVARFLNHSGAICVGIKEYDAYTYDQEGIDIELVLAHKEKHGTISTFGKMKPATSNKIFTEACDILVLAAQQKSLSCYLADKVQAKVILEAANGAITPSAHRILVGRSKLVLPDIYVCSGYSVASYLEHLLDLKQANCNLRSVQGLYMNLLGCFDKISEKCTQVVATATTQKIIGCDMKPDVLTYAIEHVMQEVARELIDINKEFNLSFDLRTAAYIRAIQNLHNSIFELKKD